MKRIGITLRIVDAKDYYDPRDALSHEWQDYLKNQLPFITPILLMNDADRIIHWMEQLEIEGVILSNGNDLGSAPIRDETEQRLFNYCFKNNLPILGVCRGLQAINQFMRGDVERDLHINKYESHVNVDHTIHLTHPSFLLTNSENIVVNSYHNQGVLDSDVSEELEVFAKSDNGVIEGLFHRNKPILAIQWHPERKHPSSNYDQKLIRRFFKEEVFW